MHMVCYKTDVDSPYLGKSIRLSPPPLGHVDQPKSIYLPRAMPSGNRLIWGDQHALGGNRRRPYAVGRIWPVNICIMEYVLGVHSSREYLFQLTPALDSPL